MGFSMEISIPHREYNAAELMDVIMKMGAVTLGGYAIKDGKFIKGAKYEGGNLIKLGKLHFLVIVDGESGNVKLQNIDFNSGYILAENMPVVITGLPSGEKVLFACKEDAVEWLSTLQTSQVLKLSVKDGDFHGSAVMYR